MRNKAFVIAGLVAACLILFIIVSILMIDKTEKVFAQVGEEKIYQKDIDHLVAMYPGKSDKDKIANLAKEVLIRDSIILQAAQAQKIIQVDGTFFGSAAKNLAKRHEMAEIVKAKVNSQVARIEGRLIAVWFYNNYMANQRLGYNEAKKLAFAKITAVHDFLKINNKSIDSIMIDELMNDREIAMLDPAYRENISHQFAVNKGATISKSEALDNELWQLNEGEMSQVYVLRLGRYDIESAYIFGVVEEKVESDFANFDEWYKAKSKIYEIKYY